MKPSLFTGLFAVALASAVSIHAQNACKGKVNIVQFAPKPPTAHTPADMKPMDVVFKNNTYGQLRFKVDYGGFPSNSQFLIAKSQHIWQLNLQVIEFGIVSNQALGTKLLYDKEAAPSGGTWIRISDCVPGR